jgi:hypothetical protein
VAKPGCLAGVRGPTSAQTGEVFSAPESRALKGMRNEAEPFS